MMFDLWLQEESPAVPMGVLIPILLAMACLVGVLWHLNKQKQGKDAVAAAPQPAKPAPSPMPVAKAPSIPIENLADPLKGTDIPKTPTSTSTNPAIAARQRIQQSIATGEKLTTESVAQEASAPTAPVAAKAETDCATDMIHEAELLRGNGRRDLAVKKLRELISREPSNAAALQLLGDVLTETEDLAGAAEAYRESAKANPRSSQVCTSLAKVLEQLGDVPGAISAYRAATIADPEDYKAFNNLGGLLAETGDMGGGVEAFRKALAINPNDEAAKENLALAEELLHEQNVTA